MKYLKTLIILLLAIQQLNAQDHSRFGLEVRSSRHMSYNCCSIYTGGPGFFTYEVTKERNLATTDYSLGILYQLNDRSLLKFHVGKHQNGRKIDLTIYYDNFTFMDFENANLLYDYLQFTPSYVYHLKAGKAKIPLEGGININKNINKAELFYIPVKDYNFDLRLAIGYEQSITSNMSVGVNAVYTRAITSYQTSDMRIGKYSPLQLGIELNVKYFY